MRLRNDMNLWWGMWCIAVAIFFLGLLCTLTGCSYKTKADSRFIMTEIEDGENGCFYTIEDTETGDKYLYLSRAGGYGGLALMPEPVDEVTFTGAETKVFSAAPPVEEPIPEAYDEVTDEPELESLGMFRVTAYCACEKCCGKTSDDPWYGITATGTKATEGRTIAVDPKVISYGSVVYFEGIDGFGGYVAEDCGGAIKGNDIDLYFDSHEEALRWGVKELEVFQMKE